MINPIPQKWIVRLILGVVFIVLLMAYGYGAYFAGGRGCAAKAGEDILEQLAKDRVDEEAVRDDCRESDVFKCMRANSRGGFLSIPEISF